MCATTSSGVIGFSTTPSTPPTCVPVAPSLTTYHGTGGLRLARARPSHRRCIDESIRCRSRASRARRFTSSPCELPRFLHPVRWRPGGARRWAGTRFHLRFALHRGRDPAALQWRLRSSVAMGIELVRAPASLPGRVRDWGIRLRPPTTSAAGWGSVPGRRGFRRWSRYRPPPPLGESRAVCGGRRFYNRSAGSRSRTALASRMV